jgi:hypothetical protein
VISKWKLNRQDIDNIITAYKSGVRQSLISKMYKIDHSTVYYHVKKAGVFKKVIKGQINISPFKKERMVCYQDYLETEENRKLRLQEVCEHEITITTTICRTCGKVTKSVDKK